MPSPVIEIRGLEEITRRMRDYPQKLSAAIKTTLGAALLALWENVPPYPPPPENSTYVRTGTLGRTLGSSEGGGKSGQPDIYEVKPLGGGEWEAHFGTNLEYAPYVIGDDTQARHMQHWWKISVIKERAAEKINRLFGVMADKLAAWLDGKNL